MEKKDTYTIIQKDHPWFDPMKEFLVCSASSMIYMEWDDFIDALKSTYTQGCFLAGSLLHITLTHFHYKHQLSVPVPKKCEYKPGDIDIWVYDKEGFETKEMDYDTHMRELYSHYDAKKYQLQDALRVAIESARIHKIAKIENFNVIHSINATSLKTLLNSFDLDCLRFGYDVGREEFFLHKEALPSIRSLKTEYTMNLMGGLRDPFVEHVVILEYNSSCSFDDEMNPKYPILYPYTDHGIFRSKTYPIKVHPSHFLERLDFLTKRARATSLSQFVYDYLWKKIRNLNVNLNNPSEVKKVEELGALFDSKTFGHYIPSDLSILDFAEFFDCPLFSPDSIKEWYRKGGILVFSQSCPKIFMHLASTNGKWWLCNNVSNGKFSEEDVRFLLYEARVAAEDIFNILNPYYFDRSTTATGESLWGHGILTKVNEEVLQNNSYPSLTFFNTEVAEKIHEFYQSRTRLLSRIEKYKNRGYIIYVKNDMTGRNANWIWMFDEIEALESKGKDKISENLEDCSIRQYLTTFFPRSLQLNLSKDFIQNVHEEEAGDSIYSQEEKNLYRVSLHPVIIDNRIFRLITAIFEKEYRSCLNIPEGECIHFQPSVFNKQYSHMNLPHVICCKYMVEGREKKLFLRVHEENTFYQIIENEVKAFWSEENRKQYNFLTKLFEIAKRERNHFHSHRETTFSLWSLLGSKKDVLNYVVYDTILKRVYMVSVSSFINEYCGKAGERELHDLKRGFLGFDCLLEL